MDLRKTINQHRWIAIVIVTAIIAIAGYQVYSELVAGVAAPSNAAFYSSDDGKTFFSDSDDLRVPFERDGKECVAARVFECEGKQFVGYLAKMTPAGKAAVDQYYADVANSPDARPASWAAADAANANGWLFKRPGEAEWKPGGAPTRLAVKCPDGNPAAEVLPP